MAEIKEFTPSIKEGSKPEKPADIISHEEFQKRSAEMEIKRRNENPLGIEEIFELVNERKLTKERLEDFELDPELQTALKWVIDLLAKIDQKNQAIQDHEKLIEQLKSIVADLDAKHSA